MKNKNRGVNNSNYKNGLHIWRWVKKVDCELCGKTKPINPIYTKYTRKLCDDCRYKFRKHAESKIKDGYRYIFKPDHPNKDIDGYVPEHRLLMENKIGRYLRKEEVVHHINHNRLDNRIENLMLIGSNSEHIKLHSQQLKKSRNKYNKYWTP